MPQNHHHLVLRRVEFEPDSKVDVFVQTIFHNDFNTRRWLKKNGLVLLISLIVHALILFVVSFLPGRDAPRLEEVVMIHDYLAPDIQDAPQTMDIPHMLNLKDLHVQKEIAIPHQDELDEIGALEKKICLDEISELDGVQNISWVNAMVSSGPDMPNYICLKFKNRLAGDNTTGYGFRRGSYKSYALQKFGGNSKTNEAVDNALEWLARHQDPNGSWNASRWTGAKDTVDLKLSATACALLPFLGAGYSENMGPYRKVVRSGIRFINSSMDARVAENGQQQLIFGKNYGTALALMALAESSMFGSSPSTTRNANLLAAMLLKQQSEFDKGWSYQGGGEDLSVTGWVFMGLRSAMDARLRAMDERSTSKAFAHLKDWIKNEMADPKSGFGLYRPTDKAHVCNMTWLAMIQKLYLGFPKSDPFLVKAGENSLKLKWIDQAFAGHRIQDSSTIYYGTLASFQQQGPFWEKWNEQMKTFLLKTQRPGIPDELGGSWDAGSGILDKTGGRVMSTALMAMCLEVYYRHRLVN